MTRSDSRPLHTFLSFLNEEDLKVTPIESAETIPSGWYTDPRFYELEKQTLFLSSWNYLGQESRLSSVGDQVVREIPGNPVLLVRGNDNQPRAFYNVCRHRGGPVALEDCRAKVLQCKYHGWTYTLEGSLRGIPRFGRSDLFNKSDYGLVPLKLKTWSGFLFASAGEGAVPLETLLSGIAEEVGGAGFFHDLKHYRRVEYAVQCNWKAYVDNYLEGYHVPMVHPSLNSILSYSRYSTDIRDYHSVQKSPLSANDHSYGTGKGGEALYYFVFPNFMMNILPGRMQTNLVLPVSHRECKVVFEYFYHDVSDDAVGQIEKDIAYSDLVQKEDVAICEHVQRGLESRGYDQGRFSPEMETGVYHFQTLLKEELGRMLESA